MRRVAVTGMGVVSPLGNGASQAFAQARAGHSGVHCLQASFTDRLTAPLAATASFNGADHFEPPKLRMLDRVSQFALVAASQAVADARPATTGTRRCMATARTGSNRSRC